MNIKLIKLFLLLSLFFNIAHASVIAMEDDCHHNTVAEYLMEENIADECGDLCDMDHLFHFIAILNTPDLTFDTLAYKAQPAQKTTLYHPPFKENTTKPPIV
ncbi:MAG: hypothetical protein J7J02_03570 [Sulfurovum sp.]|nr:hypothetical protein [Sulfurovum sp.]